MIKQLQFKFIAIATGAIGVVIVVLLILLNTYNFQAMNRQISTTLHYLSQNNGVIADDENSGSGSTSSSDSDSDELPFEITDESKYQLRYFSIWLNDQDHTEVISSNMEHIATIDEEEAERIAENVAGRNQQEGRILVHGNHYAYLVSEKPKKNALLIIVLDYSSDFFSVTSFISRSMLFAILCIIFFIVVVFFFSKRAIRPLVRNMESQKQFITDAGHELKTPLTIISANAEVLELMNGESEWTQSIRSQVQRMAGLVDDLIALSRLTEHADPIIEDTDLSGIVNDSVSSFKPVADREAKSLTGDIRPDIHIKASRKGILELVNILLDNAVKYCDDGGDIQVLLTYRSGSRGARLSVSNSYAEGKGQDYNRFFERFYRGDTSHNSAKAGYGIGLSMAKEFVSQYKGKMTVGWKDGIITFTVTFP